MDYAWVPDNGLEQPVPATLPTPALTAYDIVFEGSFFLPKTQMLYLYRGHEPLIIMIARKNPPEDHFPEWCRYEIAEELAEQQHALEICQTLLHALPFGKISSAYLVQGAGGAWRCVSGQKYMGLSFPAQRNIAIADVADVQFTRLASPMPDHHEGFWQGMAVDVWRPRPGHWRDREDAFRFIEASRMYGNIELPYSFKVLAVLTEAGAGVGLVFEPWHGRPIALSDRAAVYEAFADLERHDLVYMCVYHDRLAIGDDGVLKLLRLQELRRCSSDPAKREQELRDRHWDSLRDMFSRIREFHMVGRRFARDCLYIGRYCKAHSDLLRPLPSPSPIEFGWGLSPEVIALVDAMRLMGVLAKDSKGKGKKKAVHVSGRRAITGGRNASEEERASKAGDKDEDYGGDREDLFSGHAELWASSSQSQLPMFDDNAEAFESGGAEASESQPSWLGNVQASGSSWNEASSSTWLGPSSAVSLFQAGPGPSTSAHAPAPSSHAAPPPPPPSLGSLLSGLLSEERMTALKGVRSHREVTPEERRGEDDSSRFVELEDEAP